MDVYKNYAKHSVELMKSNGEVFTPFNLVNEMLDKLPKELFSNPYLKWLDPCNGLGAFPINLIERLDKGLEFFIKDEIDRKRWIIEKMIYTCEINEDSCNKYKEIIGEYNVNLYIGNSLEMPRGYVWNNGECIGEFDVVLGNPPYLKNIWYKFIKKFLGLVKYKGYFLFVNPAGWRKPASIRSKNYGMFDLMAHQNQIVYLNINDRYYGEKIFKCGTRVDYYLIQKKKCDSKTEINDEKGEINYIDLNLYHFLPNFDFEFILSLTDEYNKSNIIRCSGCDTRGEKMKEVLTDTHNNICIHSTPKRGVRYLFSNTKNNNYFGIPKIIFGDSGFIFGPVLDINGIYGLTNQTIAFRINDYADGIFKLKVLKSDKFKRFLEANWYGNFRIDSLMFCYFKSNLLDLI